MNRNLLIVIWLLVAGLFFSADFRNVSWGMTKAEVKAAETAKPLDCDDINQLVYITQVNNITMNVIYYFTPITKMLYSASYITPDSTYLDDSRHFSDDYESFKSILSKIYGKPYEVQDAVTKKDDGISYINEPYCKYKNSVTTVLLKIILTEHDIYLCILYFSIKYNDIADKEDSQQIDKDLGGTQR